MRARKQRLWYVILIALFLGGATLVVLTTLNDHLLFFMMPTDVLVKKPATPFRLGGLVEKGSLHRQEGLLITFRVTDGEHVIPVHYHGIVPDLFREGQGVVAEGMLSREGVFQATRLLAKHDEKYMPRDVAEALNANGQGQPVREQSP